MMSRKNKILSALPVKKLSDVCTYSKGKMPQVLVKEKSKECSIPYINIKAFEKGIFAEYTNGVKCNLCKNADLLMVWDGARCGLIGKAKKGAVGSTLMKILPKENIHKEYLYHFISSKFRTLNTKPKGVGIPHIEPTLLWNFELIIPPLPEQQAIVAKIEELLSDLENGKQQLQTAQQQLKVYRQSLLKWAFEGKLTNKNVKEGELPRGWKWVKVGDLRTKEPNSICAGPFGTIFKAKDFRPSGIPIIFLRHVKAGSYNTRKPGYMDEGIWKELFKSYSVYGGELLITKLGEPPGECAIYPNGIGPAMVTPDVIKMNVDENSVVPKFLMYYFNSENSRKALRNIAFGSTRPRITIPIFKNLPVPFCDKKEQQLIVSELESKLTVCDKIEETISQSLQQAETLRQSILKKAFEGKLVQTEAFTGKKKELV